MEVYGGVMAEETIFTKIIKGEIPSYKIFEDDKVFAFMDIHPIQPGQVLVVTKKPVKTFEQLEEGDYQALMSAVQEVAKKIKEALKPLRVGVIIEGFEVDHVHVKVFPVNNEKELRHLPDQDKEPDFVALEEMANKLKL